MTVASILLAWGIFINCVPISRAVPLRKPFSGFPARIGAWESAPAALDEDVLRVLGVTDYLSRFYQRGADEVDVYVGYYDSQAAGRQIHSPKHCLPGSGWNFSTQTTREIDLEAVGKIRFVEAVYEKGGERLVLVYWYRMMGAYVTNEYVMKLRMIANSVLYRRNEATFVRLSALSSGDERRAFEVVRGFMVDFLPQLQAHLPR